MKRKIEDYIGQKVAIYCSSKEEWDQMSTLFGKKGLTREYGDISEPDNIFVNCIHINGMGTASKKYYEKENYSIYPASDFLEEVIPEYVEYIDTKYKGQIVKVEEWTNHNFCYIRFENGQREQPFKDLVKLSTKEAYEAQNKPKQLTGYNLLPNEIYVTTKPTAYIFKTSETGRGYSHYIYQFNSYNSISPNKDYIWTGNLRLAPNEEKKWLNTCISQDKFIPKEDLHLYDDSGLLIKKEKSLEKQVEEGLNKSFQYPLTPKETFFTKTDKLIINGLLDRIGQPFKNNINSEDIYITPIIKKQTKLQTITIESSADLNLNLTKIKSKQIQTIKI